MNRRKFLESALGAGLYHAIPAAAAVGNRASVTVLLDEPVATISSDLYGYLLENLGNVIYDGVWVGEDSKIANIGGIRSALVDHLQKIKASVIRWPGGNFADYYDWRDGIGPRQDRPRRTNVWSDYMRKNAPAGPQRYDPNQFGTHEFMQLCRLTGGRPFLNLNLRSMGPMENAQWVDYCNAPASSTTLADLRARNGSVQPFNVDYWGIGNEPWAFGGNMSARDYAAFYRRCVQGIPLHGRELKFIACGGTLSDWSADWSRTFLEECKRAEYAVPVAALSIHYYTSHPWSHARRGETFGEYMAAHDDRPRKLIDPVRYDSGGWYSVLASSARIEELIDTHWKVWREVGYGPDIRLAVDEWGGIFDSGDTELNDVSIRARAVTLRDALSAALTLDVFHKHADKLINANFTGLINQEGGLFRADGNRFVATPIYHVFDLYADHQGGRSLRTVFAAPAISSSHEGRPVSLWGLNGSASLKGETLTLTVVNPHVSEPRESSLEVRGARISSMTATTLTHSDIHAQNTFEQPQHIKPVMQQVPVENGSPVYVFPPRSVTKLTLQLR